MRSAMFLTMFFLGTLCYGQEDQRITTMDFVQIQNSNYAEALYYYQNNWKALRKNAVERGYIHSYELLEVEPTADQPYTFILVSTYSNKSQFDKREENFSELIEERGERKLMNEKQPAEFRKILFSHSSVKHK